MLKFSKNNFKKIELIIITLLIPLVIIFLNLQTYVILFLIFTCFFIYIFRKEDLKKIHLPKNRYVYKKLVFKDLSLFIFLILFLDLLGQVKLIFYDLKNFHYLILLSLIYLVFSVIPQEIIFRYYFFTRYKDVFKSKYILITVNSFIFSIFHVIYLDIKIIFITFLGSLLFSANYMKFNSLILVILQHFLFGQIFFMLGFLDNFELSLIKNLYNIMIIN